jgi:hypothetical protein
VRRDLWRVRRDLQRVRRDLLCVRRDLSCVRRDLSCMRRDLWCVRRDLWCINRDLSGEKPDLFCAKLNLFAENHNFRAKRSAETVKNQEDHKVRSAPERSPGQVARIHWQGGFICHIQFETCHLSFLSGARCLERGRKDPAQFLVLFDHFDNETWFYHPAPLDYVKTDLSFI